MFQAVLLIAGCLAAVPLAADDDPDRSLQPATLGWSGAHLRASKFFLSADARIDVELHPAGAILPGLLQSADFEFLMPEERIVDLHLAMRGLGRETDLTLLLDPFDATAFQRSSRDRGSRQRHRIYRFADNGVYQRTRWPEKGEEDEPPQSWTGFSSGLRPWPPGIAGGRVSEASALIYAASAARITDPGDRLELLTYARRRVFRVVLEVGDAEEVDYRFRQTAPGKPTERRGRLQATRILITGEPLASENDRRDFELLGLRGKLELLLDPVTRVPLQLSGDVKLLGRVNFRLIEAEFRDVLL